VLKHFWGGSKETMDAIRKEYPLSKFPSEKERFRIFYNYGTFVCGTRYIADAYKGKVYNMVFSQGGGTHGADIGTTFYSPNFLMDLLRPGFGKLASNYQSYLISHARSGDPNKFRSASGTIEWPKVTYGPVYSNVLNVTDNGFTLIKDEGNTEADCGFWRKTLQGLTKAEGEFGVILSDI
jgi:Carboxylesterase family